MGFFSGEKLIVGYDLGDEYSQISYAYSEKGEAETLSQVAGEQIYNIPTVLCKKQNTNQWFFGREALRCEGDGILVKNLLSLALDGEPVIIEGESYDPVALLALFFKRTLGLLSRVGSKITALMVTCPRLDRGIVETLSCGVGGSQLKAGEIAFQSHAESFYGYLLRQPRELWNYPALLFELGQKNIRLYRTESNKKTKPKVVFIEEKEYAFPEYEPNAGEGNEISPEKQAKADEAFLKIAEEACGGGIIGSIFLIGDGFAEGWMKDSLRFLCRGRRVFQGNNLFSKGACSGMQERLAVSEAGKEHVFLGNDKLKANIGMKILRQGEESYYALLDAGVNWYEAERTVEVYVQDGNAFLLLLAPLVGNAASGEKVGRSIQIVLEGLSGNVARLRLHFFMKTEKCLMVEAEDLGFGEYRVPSGRVWKEEIEIYGG